ncbi:hypothetical protein APHAL10511_000852 [Amanita phalloides]|nr:hypothetical protein APHAL10511_000852 [Amanita phalloides]
MKKFFAKKDTKHAKDPSGAVEDRHFPTPIHAQYANFTQNPVNVSPLYPNSHLRDNVRHSSPDDQQWEVVSTHDDAAHTRVLAPSRAASLPPGASPPLPTPPAQRSPSPYSLMSNLSNKSATVKESYPHSGNTPKKKQHSHTPAALGILRSLDPASRNDGTQLSLASTEEKSVDANHGEQDRSFGEKKERRGFWGTTKDKHRERVLVKDRGKERDQRDDAELTRMIGYLTATASEDWTLVLEVCDRASANGDNAKEAVRALRREFRYGEPPAQLSAARLWAIMSRNCSGIFVTETSSRKFLVTLEELITSSRTSPVVRERLIDVVGNAAYNSAKDSGYRNLWRKVKPVDKPDEGVPFDKDDAIINPPTGLRHTQNGVPGLAIQHSLPTTPMSAPLTNTPNTQQPSRKRSLPTSERIIPPDEDIRRLFQECHIGMGNAALLSDALAACKPEKLKSDAVIREFCAKCRSSQELIFAQIPWATAGAERSRAARSQQLQTGQRPPNGERQTTEEKLFGELLKANEELLFVLKQYEDLERVAVERRTEDLSRKQTRMDHRYIQYQDSQTWPSSEYTPSLAETTSSRSPSPSLRSNTPPRHAQSQPFYHSRSQSSLDNQSQLLAPPPAAPHGPRSPIASLISRAPSSGISSNEQPLGAESPLLEVPIQNAIANMNLGDHPIYATGTVDDGGDGEDGTPARPSAKALGKRRLVEGVVSSNFNQLYQANRDSFDFDDTQVDSDQEDDEWLHPPVKYVYDAAAERTRQRIREATAAMVNGVH